jgi:2-polyprenyl-3-methyl-5-hydroxy-6-metoxy-1,4-benzoquinol methylase
MRLTLLRNRFKHLIKPGSRILDVGGFDGEISAAIRDTVPDAKITLMDLNEKGIELAKDKGLNAIKASACDIPFKNDEMDAVVCLDVFEHIPDDGKAMKEISRVLKPGGTFIFATPMLKIPFAFVDEKRRDVHTDHVRSGYTIEEIRHLFKSNGLKVIKEEKYFNILTRLSYSFATSVFGLVLPLEHIFKFGAAEYIVIGEK